MYEYSTTQRIEDIANEFYIPVSKAKKLFHKEGKFWVTTDSEIIRKVEQFYD